MLKRIWLALTLMLLSSQNFALEENEKFWAALNAQHKINDHWLSFVYSQVRFINQNQAWQSINLEGGLGYRPLPYYSFWMGYRWTGRNPYNGFAQENRLFEQFIFEHKPNRHHVVILRSRFEQIQQTDQSEIGLRFRQRFALKINTALFKQAYPFIYDEVFFNINRTPFLPDSFFGENRLFIGFNLMNANETWWEIGYINQFQNHVPGQSENQMSHIISVTYNFS